MILSALLVTALSACKPHDHLTDHGQKQASVESAASDKKMTEAEHAAMPAMAAGAKMASASGTVESVDVAAGKITLAHGPVDALGWPAMTMGFKATPEQIASVHPGQLVRFEFTAEGMNATITHIALAE